MYIFCKFILWHGYKRVKKLSVATQSIYLRSIYFKSLHIYQVR